MSTCERCGATFHCAMTDGDGTDTAPCWCTLLPPAVPVPRQDGQGGQAAPGPTGVGCWCPACLKATIAAQAEARGAGPQR